MLQNFSQSDSNRDSLLARLKFLVSEERRITTEILEMLIEVEDARLHLELAPDIANSINFQEKIRPCGNGVNRLDIFIDDETLKKMEILRAKLSHSVSGGKISDLVSYLVNRELDFVSNKTMAVANQPKK